MRSFFKHFVVIITIIIGYSCQQKPLNLAKIQGNQLIISDSIVGLDTIQQIVAPYQNRINQVLDSTLCYAPQDFVKNDGQLNYSIGNLMADIVFEQASPIIKSRTGAELDAVVLNNGGIRAIISKGSVSARNAYQVMPFENNIVIVEMSGSSLRKLAEFLIAARRAHPISGMQIIKGKNGGLESLSIQGKPFNEANTYFVATSDYLYTGGDQMGFFKETINVTETDYRIRNAMIDYFTKVDTLQAIVDDRFIQIK